MYENEYPEHCLATSLHSLVNISQARREQCSLTSSKSIPNQLSRLREPCNPIYSLKGRAIDVQISSCAIHSLEL
ncbi:hypothetical protein EUGRSUZ_E00643 [Eucalyptus grandis]|uniref:Uncharacterized protein n=2 Tax=Eucalyptus grandis TaxID=71139 RepID=A0ACC3KS12_EUCGR|nr:hypothetical protein EUGRSUZ_E00643 [Eucalyptus grandis]